MGWLQRTILVMPQISPGRRVFQLLQLTVMILLVVLALAGVNKIPLAVTIGLGGLGLAGVVSIGYELIKPENLPVAECRAGGTVLLARSTRRTAGFTILAVFVSSACLVGAVQLAADRQWILACAVGLFGAYLLMSWAHFRSGRLGAGAIVLTPEGVGQHRAGREQWIAWSDISSIDPIKQGSPVLSLQADHPSRVMHRQTAPRIFGGRRWPAPGKVDLDPRLIFVSSYGLQRIVDHCRSDAAARATLGTPASVEAISQLHREDDNGN